MTAAKLTDAYKEVQIHISDDSASAVARNVLMLHVILADGFDPENPIDLQYLWDIWYTLQWSMATKKRFIKDVKQMLTGQCWAGGRIVIPEHKDVEQFKKICNFWLDTISKRTLDEKHLHDHLEFR